MPQDVVPSWFQTRPAGFTEGGNLAFNNTLLRVGEVKEVIYPEDARSLTKKFIEYAVLVQHRERDTAVTKLYQNCLLINHLAGLADRAVYTLRPSPNQGLSGPSGAAESSTGSKVLILCINGEHAQPVIIGGIRDDRSTDAGTKAAGHHAEFTFNGVSFRVANDGGWELLFGGATDSTGATTSTTAGTSIKVVADGSLEISTAGGAQRIRVDHASGEIKILGDQTATVDAERVELGVDADEPVPKGDTLVGLMEELIDAISNQTHLYAFGATSPPVNVAQFAKIRARLRSMLSQKSFVE